MYPRIRYTAAQPQAARQNWSEKREFLHTDTRFACFTHPQSFLVLFVS
jgi:hypothetical protein